MMMQQLLQRVSQSLVHADLLARVEQQQHLGYLQVCAESRACVQQDVVEQQTDETLIQLHLQDLEQHLNQQRQLRQDSVARLRLHGRAGEKRLDEPFVC